MSERLPAPNGPRIKDTTIGADDLVVLKAGEKLTRIHELAGPHPVAWNEFRAWGPTRSRFDHQPPPPREHSTRRVAYFTFGETAFTAALAEYFQDDGGGIQPFDLVYRRPHMSVVSIALEVRVLDLGGGWVTRAGGNQAICAGSHRVAREWTRAIYRHHSDLGGLAWGSSVWGAGRCLALWERALTAFPSAPDLHRALNDTAMAVPIAAAAEELGTYF